jgi:hypothetical protein
MWQSNRSNLTRYERPTYFGIELLWQLTQFKLI